ncbi:MAG: acyltransferase [Cyanobium sp.]
MTSVGSRHPNTVWIPEVDWFDHPIPPNCHLDEHVFIDTAYGFAPFHSQRDPGLAMGEASGAYDRTTFALGPEGAVTVGAYSCLNGAYMICEKGISIGSHCLIAWGVVISDHWLQGAQPASERKAALVRSAINPERPLPSCGGAQRVVLEDNVWVGFGAVVMPGVTLGRGCIVGSRSIVREDIPPYAVVAGDPPKILRWLDPTDREESARQSMVSRHLRGS